MRLVVLREKVALMRLRYLLASWCAFSCFSGVLTAGPIFQRFEPRSLEIRNHPLKVENNFSAPYRFVLSVLGVRKRGFVPLLAVVLDPEDPTADQWIAVWNLSNTGPGFTQRLKAILPLPWWSPRGAGARSLQQDRRLPRPLLTARRRKSGSKGRFAWATAGTAADFASLFNPARFALETYRDHRNDLDDRKFHQLYPLLLLYEETSAAQPSAENLGPRAVLDLKYTALINRKALGILVNDQADYSVVDGFESRMREKMGKAASYLHSQATLHYLRFREIHFGLERRWPLYRAASLSVCKTDLPENLPDWPNHNPFDLDYNPFEHPGVQALMDEDPAAEIPLAYYVLTSDFKVRPVIVLDFFSPGNPGRRRDSAVLRKTAENVLSLYGLPLHLRALHFVGSWSLKKKDLSHFSTRSVSAGIESAKLFARMGWHFDEDTNQLLLRMLDGRTANPLSDSFARQTENAKAQHQALLQEASGKLQLLIRRIYEDRIRDELKLGQRAIFAEDFARFRRHVMLTRARHDIRSFNEQRHLNGLNWPRLLRAWNTVSSSDVQRNLPESKKFMQSLKRLYPRFVPEGYRSQVADWIFSSGSSGQGSGFSAKTAP